MKYFSMMLLMIVSMISCSSKGDELEDLPHLPNEPINFLSNLTDNYIYIAVDALKEMMLSGRKMIDSLFLFRRYAFREMMYF